MYTSKYRYKHEKKENEVIKDCSLRGCFKERGGEDLHQYRRKFQSFFVIYICLMIVNLYDQL